jgi:hypothetical protein
MSIIVEVGKREKLLIFQELPFGPPTEMASPHGDELRSSNCLLSLEVGKRKSS